MHRWRFGGILRRMIKNTPGVVALATCLAALAACQPDERYPGAFQGVIELDERLLGFEVGGRLTDVTVERGDRVTAGELLATLDDTLARTAVAGREAEATAAQARADLVRAGSRVEDIRVVQAQLRAAEATDALAQKNLARDRRLVEQGALTQSVLDESETRSRTAMAQVQTLRQQLRELRAGARSQEVTGAHAQATAADIAARLEGERAARYQLRAVTPGTVLEVHADPGEVVGPGAPVLTVADVTRPYADVFVPANDLAGLDVGDHAAVQVDSLALPVPGVVETIGRRTEFTPRYVFSERERAALSVRVRIRIDDRGRLLHAGVPAFVTIARGARP